MRGIQKKQAGHTLRMVFLCLLLLVATGAAAGCTSDRGFDALVVAVPGRSMSKLPFVIAADQGLYEKHGVNVELQLPVTDRAGAINTTEGAWAELWATAMTRYPSVGRQLGLYRRGVDIVVGGHTPTLVTLARGESVERYVALAATDCAVRYYVVARPGITRLEELEGKRLGIGGDHTTSGFAALRLVQRMGWLRDQDIEIVEDVGFGALREGLVDAVVGGDSTIEAAEREGFPVLLDTRAWNEVLTGNSVMVAPGWLDEAGNREAARRFLMAVTEAVALFHSDPELVFDVMARWHGITDPAVAEARYRRADYVPLKPYPCREGIHAMMELHDSPTMREYTPEDFYDDSLMRELDDSGFIDRMYE